MKSKSRKKSKKPSEVMIGISIHKFTLQKEIKRFKDITRQNMANLIKEFAAAIANAHDTEILDDYMVLINRFQLRPIKTEEQYEIAERLRVDLSARKMNNNELWSVGKEDYMTVLEQLIDGYDERQDIDEPQESAQSDLPPGS